ncbi:MAG: DUF2027 domain-containing protein [Prevotellaceae bacterium]|jgi:hypothetical protein|nr:DUF2027 domain-containing protein [Prevotellaceae bacterium]
MIKKGDSVRFLNSVGGGVVTRIDEKKELVYVEDSDGFEIPVLARECVLVPTVGKTTNIPVKDFKSKPATETPQTPATMLPPEPEPEPAEIYETPDGDTLKALLAFFPEDIKQLQTSSCECYLINDSNYFLFYNIITGQNDEWKSVAHGTIEPNTQEWLLNIEKEELNDWEHTRVQILAFKQDKNYTPQTTLDEKLNINPVRFYKLHSFTENDYSDDPALIIDITEEREKAAQNAKLAEIPSEVIKKVILTREEAPSRPKIRKKRPQKAQIIEVDLHSRELLDTTAGMSNADILQYQLDKFHETLNEYKDKRGQRIVFIHGKGEGVLRGEIENQLKTRYKSYYFQDASFREYGFGATLVMIR